MKKAFDANVSRAKPRVRLGPLGDETEAAQASAVEAIAQAVAQENAAAPLASQLKERIAASREQRPSAVAALRDAIAAPPAEGHTNEQRAVAVPAPAPAMVVRAQTPAAEVQHVDSPAPATPSMVAMGVEVPRGVAALPIEERSSVLPSAEESKLRREKLRNRLQAIREQPQQEPLPDTVAEAGIRAVERIASLQNELSKARALNASLTHDLDVARRESERATAEAKLRMDEAKRLVDEIGQRTTLVADLELEMSELEAERNEALLTVQEVRRSLEATALELSQQKQETTRREAALAESLAEEEKIAAELEASQGAALALRQSLESVQAERDALAQQVTSLQRERSELLEARKALEAVHRALSHAVVRS